MEDKYLQHEGCTPEPQQDTQESHQHQSPQETMLCGYLLYFFLALWAGLAAGRALPTDTTDATDSDMQSIIEDLQVALENYSGMLNRSHLGDLPDMPCTETAAHLEQTSTVTLRLTEYQQCVQKLQPLSPDVSALCQVITLNRDLLLHLVSYQDYAVCPSSSSSSTPMDFNSIRKSIQCLHCWRQQVAALHR